MPEGEANRRLLADGLKALLASRGAPQDSDAACQDSLDLMALADGLKSVALLGCGYAAGGWLGAVADLAVVGGFAVRRGGVPWLVREELAGLPDWYAEPVRLAWQAADIVTAAWPRAAGRLGAAPLTIDSEEEAELLGYPVCCVTDHHARRRIYHDLMVELIAARCESEAERRRFAEAEIEPSLRNEDDHRRLAEALGGEALAFAGFVPCPACAALGPRGPAGRIDLAMSGIARAHGFGAGGES